MGVFVRVSGGLWGLGGGEGSGDGSDRDFDGFLMGFLGVPWVNGGGVWGVYGRFYGCF